MELTGLLIVEDDVDTEGFSQDIRDRGSDVELKQGPAKCDGENDLAGQAGRVARPAFGFRDYIQPRSL
jgi:hypothetical protein